MWAGRHRRTENCSQEHERCLPACGRAVGRWSFSRSSKAIVRVCTLCRAGWEGHRRLWIFFKYPCQTTQRAHPLTSTSNPAVLSLQCRLRENGSHLCNRLHPEAAEGRSECQPGPHLWTAPACSSAASLCLSFAFSLPLLSLSPPLTPCRCISDGSHEWELSTAWLENAGGQTADTPFPVCAASLSLGSASSMHSLLPLLPSPSRCKEPPMLVLMGQNPPSHCSLWQDLQITELGSVLSFSLQYDFTVYIHLSTLKHQKSSISKLIPCFTLPLQ